jgi:mannose-6-phosphate isomerase-like protein (cupin superfamily)
MKEMTKKNESENGHAPRPLVRYRDATGPTSCPYGEVVRIMTGGEGGIANVHVVSVTRGNPHVHLGYNEVYYVLSGRGSATVEGEQYELRPGAVLNIPMGKEHAIEADDGDELEFIIFGTPAMAATDERFIPRAE